MKSVYFCRPVSMWMLAVGVLWFSAFSGVAQSAKDPLARHEIIPIEQHKIGPQVWDPKPSATETETVRVRVVDFGMINCRGFEDVHLGDKFAAGSFLVGGAHDRYDVNVDGNPTTRDWIQHLPFSMETPMSPETPLWDYDYIGSKFYGGYTFNFANRMDRGLTEQQVNANESHNHMQPANNWALHCLNKIKGSPFTCYGAWIWKKEDARHFAAGPTAEITFDETSRLAHFQQRYFSGWEGVKFIVQDGDRFYLSESLSNEVRDDGKSASGIYLIREACPLDLKWIEWKPVEGTHEIHFDAAAEYKPHGFTNVQAIGWYTYKDTLDENAVSSKWESFECFANVTRPAVPCELMAMKKVDDCYMAITEVSYQVWKEIYRWSSGGGQWTLWPGPCQYDRDGDMGSMDYKAEVHGHAEPVTDITIYDAILWCNKLSQYEGKDPVYYTDKNFETPFNIARESQWFSDPAFFERPTVYVKWRADGYRLPTPSEWMKARGVSSAAAVSNPNSTAPVGSGAANANGFYDMDGNVWELVWTYGDTMSPDPDTITVVGGDFTGDKKASSSAYGSKPYGGHFNIGFRFVRREHGLGKPAAGESVPAAKTWVIRKADVMATSVPEESAIEFVKIPSGKLKMKVNIRVEQCTLTDFEMASREVSYAEWKKVYDWARAQGYSFDFDGDVGSMDYKMFMNQHSPDEPVTDINYYDMLAWCNALSEMQGKTPVFYTDSAKTQLFKNSERWESALYRGPDSAPSYQHEKYLWKNDGNGKKKIEFSTFVNTKSVKNWTEHVKLFMKWDADGYRLPTMAEFSYAYTAGAGTEFPWGGSYEAIEDNAWYYWNSDNKTHDVGEKPPNAFGLYDMVGNVAEFHLDSDRKGAGEAKSIQTVNPLQNFSCSDFSSRWRVTFLRTAFNYDDKGSVTSNPMSDRGHEYGGTTPGWHWPDIGFRPVSNPNYLPVGYDPSATPTAATPLKLDDPVSGYDAQQGKTYRGNNRRTGEYEGSGARSLREIKWSLDTGAPIIGSPVEQDGMVYIGNSAGDFFGIDAASGAVVWKIDAGGEIISSPTVTGGTVFFTTRKGGVYALDAKTGAQKWKYNFIGGNYKNLYASPGVAYGTVFIPGHDNRGPFDQPGWGARPGIGLDVKTGKKVWEQKEARSQQTFGSCYTILPGKLIVATKQSSLNVLDLKTGLFQMKGRPNRTFGDGGFTGAIAMKDGIIYALERMTGDNNGCEPIGTIMAVQEKNMKKYLCARYAPAFPEVTSAKRLVGKSQGKDYMFFAAPCVADGKLFVCCNTGTVTAFDAKNPAETIWVSEELGGQLMSAPSYAQGVLYLGCNDGNIYSLNAKTGKVIGQCVIGGTQITSSPYIGDGTVYIGSDNGSLYAIQ